MDRLANPEGSNVYRNVIANGTTPSGSHKICVFISIDIQSLRD